MGKCTMLSGLSRGARLSGGAGQKSIRDAPNSSSCPPTEVPCKCFFTQSFTQALLWLQARELQKGCDVLIATPGRLNHFIERGLVSLSHVRHMILDEADRMLDMGFESQIRQITDDTDLPMPGDGLCKNHQRGAKTGFPARVLTKRYSKLFYGSQGSEVRKMLNDVSKPQIRHIKDAADS